MEGHDLETLHFLDHSVVTQCKQWGTEQGKPSEKELFANKIQLDENWERQEEGSSMYPKVWHVAVRQSWDEHLELGLESTEEGMLGR